MQEVNLKVL